MTPCMVYEYPLRIRPNVWLAQVIIPRDMTSAEAERLCAFIMTLPIPSPTAAVKEEQ